MRATTLLSLAILIPLSLTACGTAGKAVETAKETEKRVDEASMDRWCRKARWELLDRFGGDVELTELVTQACLRRATS